MPGPDVAGSTFEEIKDQVLDNRDCCGLAGGASVSHHLLHLDKEEELGERLVRY
jgi:hypothetical protein